MIKNNEPQLMQFLYDTSYIVWNALGKKYKVMVTARKLDNFLQVEVYTVKINVILQLIKQKATLILMHFRGKP